MKHLFSLLFFAALWAPSVQGQTSVCKLVGEVGSLAGPGPLEHCLNFGTGTASCTPDYVAASGPLSPANTAVIDNNPASWVAIPKGQEITVNTSVHWFAECFDPFILDGNECGFEPVVLNEYVDIWFGPNFYSGVLSTSSYQEESGNVLYQINFHETAIAISADSPTYDSDPSTPEGLPFTMTFYKENGTIAYQLYTRVVVTGSEAVGDPAWVTQTPQAPQLILRNPPGDLSYANFTNTEVISTGIQTSISTDNALDVWGSVRLGASGSVGLIAETEFEVYAELSGGLTMGMSTTAENESTVTFSNTAGYETASSPELYGSAGDLYIGAAMEYLYGIFNTVTFNGCEGYNHKEELILAPSGNTDLQFIWTEDYLVNTKIPELQAQLAELDSLTESDAYWTVHDNLEIWEQTLAMNDAIVEQAIASGEFSTTSITGGGSAFYQAETTTSTTQSLEMNMYIDANVALEIGASTGGSGVSFGTRVRTRTDRGATSTNTTEITNTMTYELGDDDSNDIFAVRVYSDGVFGTPIFVLDELTTTSSCPHEGGTALDQPDLFFQDDSTTLIYDNAPQGATGTVEIKLCNNGSTGRYYKLGLNTATNPGGLDVQAFGNDINATDAVWLEPGTCLENVVVSVTQDNLDITTYEGLELYLYAECQPWTDPIYESIFLDVTFTESVGVEEQVSTQANAYVYPNPADDAFAVECTQLRETGQLTLLDLTGRSYGHMTVSPQQARVNWDARELPAGTYLLTLTTAHERITKRVNIR